MVGPVERKGSVWVQSEPSIHVGEREAIVYHVSDDRPAQCESQGIYSILIKIRVGYACHDSKHQQPLDCFFLRSGDHIGIVK